MSTVFRAIQQNPESSQHKIQNVQDTIQKYSTYYEQENMSQSQRKQLSIDRKSTVQMLELSDKIFEETI